MEEAELSRHFIEVIPRTMRAIRAEMRGVASDEFTTLQFRILANLARKASSNKDLAKAIGISVPGASRMADVLVRGGYVLRSQDRKDRRQVALSLTPLGRRRFENFRAAAQIRFSEYFSSLQPGQRETLASGLTMLSDLFGGTE